VSIPLGEEVSQASGRVGLGVVAEKIDEVGHIELIGCEGRLDGSTVSPHPLKEFTNDRRWLRQCLCGCNATAFAEMAHKDPNARDYVAGVVL
jgi:hypothetical protein